MRSFFIQCTHTSLSAWWGDTQRMGNLSMAGPQAAEIDQGEVARGQFSSRIDGGRVRTNQRGCIEEEEEEERKELWKRPKGLYSIGHV